MTWVQSHHRFSLIISCQQRRSQPRQLSHDALYSLKSSCRTRATPAARITVLAKAAKHGSYPPPALRPRRPRIPTPRHCSHTLPPDLRLRTPQLSLNRPTRHHLRTPPQMHPLHHPQSLCLHRTSRRHDEGPSDAVAQCIALRRHTSCCPHSIRPLSATSHQQTAPPLTLLTSPCSPRQTRPLQCQVWLSCSSRCWARDH